MKNPSLIKSILAGACAVAISTLPALSQDSVVSTGSTTNVVTSDGVVQQIIPTSSQILVTSSTSAAPVKYTFTKTTTFTDAAGNAVSYETFKQNTPARIYYTKVGDSYVVTRMVSNPTVTTTTVAPVTTTTVVPAETPLQVIESTTTTTKTEK